VDVGENRLGLFPNFQSFKMTNSSVSKKTSIDRDNHVKEKKERSHQADSPSGVGKPAGKGKPSEDVKQTGDERPSWREGKNEVLKEKRSIQTLASRDSMRGNGKEKCVGCLKLFATFCCPPGVCCVTSVLGNRLAFLPPPPSYQTSPLFQTMDEKGKSEKWRKRHRSEKVDYYLILKPEARWPFDEVLLDCIKVHFVTTKRKSIIMCMFIRCVEQAKFTIFFSHGNASDLGQGAAPLIQLGLFLGCNIFTYDYSGYGESKGRASEKNIYADADAAYEAMQSRWGIKEDQTILYGQSVGSAPTVHLAVRHKVAGVVIHSGFMSGLRVVCPNRMYGCCAPGQPCDSCCDILVNISHCPQIESTVLIIHGKDDNLIHIKHGRELFQACRNTVTPLWVDHADHNNVQFFLSYWLRMKRFIEVDISQSPQEEQAPDIIRPSQGGPTNLFSIHV